MTNKRIRKAVFPVAGLGTRFLPATKTVPKEMLPIIDRPLIQYAVEEAIEAGCDTLVFVTNRYKHSIADYFDKHYELEHKLFKAGKFEQLEQISDTLPSHVRGCAPGTWWAMSPSRCCCRTT
jgi:UTP--glucose-1-phosphate uridylyltransferase